MASTLTRLVVSNDTGTPASPNGDGTLINAALLTTLQDNIDALLTVGGSGSPGVLTIGADLTVEGFGTHTFSAGGTGGNILLVRNTTAGTSSYGALHVGNDSSATRVRLLSLSTTHSTANEYYADGCTLVSAGAGGLQLSAANAAGVIRLYTGSTPTEHVKLNATGKLLLRHGAATYDENYGPLSITGPGTNFGQQVSLIRSGAAAWSLGFAYNTSTFAIGTGQATDSNFTAAAAALTITTAGEVQAPLQPGFLAYNTTDQASVASGTTITLGTEDYDAGGDFASNTFTAPVAGKYAFAWSVLLKNVSGGAQEMGVTLHPSAGPSSGFLVGYVSSIANAAQQNFAGSIVLDLAAAETVALEVYGAGTYDVRGGAATQPLTWFCGRLVP